MEKEKIQFKPLHEGMGFHPFSDGLPYAPESKSRVPNTGIGATSAGRPSFTTPQAPTPKATLRQLQERGAQPPHSQPASTHAPLSIAMEKPLISQKIAPQAAAIPQPAPFEELSPLLRKRFVAYLMDTVIHAGFWLATNLAALFFFKFQIDAEILHDNAPQFILFFLVSQWMFIGLQESLFETSIGKLFFNLEFKRNHTSLFFRSFVFMVGFLCLGLGLYFRPQDRFGKIQNKRS